jgi:hypothetical protein
MRKKKVRRIIAAEEVAIVFSDAQVAELAKIAKLPPATNMGVLAEGVREAARFFARDARVPTANELHGQIAALLKASEERRYDDVARLLGELSPQARYMLPIPSLPNPDALHDVDQREAACVSIAASCQFGGQFVQGRKRPSGNRSRPVWRPYLHAPEPQTNFAKRHLERDFVVWLSIAWLEATGAKPSQTARHCDGSRRLGPFARFARECLDHVGAPGADIVELINGLHRRRREMERYTGKGRPK